jgi:hypothetical protein
MNMGAKVDIFSQTAKRPRTPTGAVSEKDVKKCVEYRILTTKVVGYLDKLAKTQSILTFTNTSVCNAG